MSTPRRFLDSALILSLSLIISKAGGQISQSSPFPRTGDAIVVDGSGDQLWRLMDLNLDGDWNDAGEVVPYFTTAPGIVLGNPTSAGVGPDGSVFVADSTNDQIVRLRDMDGDGVALSAGEATVFFTSTGNASGIGMPTAQGMTVSADGAVWVTNANTSTVGNDAVIRLFDADGGGDAQQAGEAVEYALFSPGAATGVSIPSNIAIGADGAVYCLDNGTGAKGIFRLHDDVVPNGVCTDTGEVAVFYFPAPPAPTPPQQCWGLAADRNGNFWLMETQYDRILRVNDLNLDLSIQLGGMEESTFYTGAAPSTLWGGAFASDGSLYVVDDGGTSGTVTVGDRILRLTDLDLNGDAQGAGEAVTVYDDAIASVDLASIRAIAFLRAPSVRLDPNPATLGMPATLRAEAGLSDLMNVWGSLVPASVTIPPYGTVGISLATPGLYFELLPAFVLGPTGTFALPLVVPNDPMLLFATFHLQAIGGPPARLQLSNVIAVTFM